MRVHINKAIVFSVLAVSAGFGQGISRTQGAGFRLNYWNITGQTTRIDVDNLSGQTNVNISGVGASAYYFSRAYRDLFLEMSIGVVSGIEVGPADISISDYKVESLVPFLVGLRYDFLSTLVSGAIHPYIAAGGGPYSTIIVQGKDKIIYGDSGQNSFESRMEYGWYIGGGVNFVLVSWLAINADLKYHSIDFTDFKDYSGLQLGIGASIMWGRKRAIYEITDVKLVVSDIYPVYYQFYKNYPIALVTVRNMVGHPIEVNISSAVKGYSQRTKDSGFMRLNGGETRDIPVSVYFDHHLLDNNFDDSVILDMDVQVKAATSYTDELSTELVIRGKNAWNGDMEWLPLFLTPENESIRDLARRTALSIEGKIEPGLEKFNHAQALFHKLYELDIKYLSDPNVAFDKDDRVQFAEKTVDAGSGDCDDLVVLYASLLESVGIQTAFVEVRDPDKELAHLYLLFNSGVRAEDGSLISNNEKRYIVRENNSGQSTVWIPVETTLIEENFEQAWNYAAMAYLQDGVLRNGLAENWVKIIDHH
jgi:hypothetical protein